MVVDKDTNAAALRLAVAGGAGSFAYLHVAAGLGCGLVIGGAVHRGTRTGAGEFGHQVVQLDGPVCGCGNRGCVEALCLAAVARGDVAEAARVLGVGASNLVALLDVDLVLLGGRIVAGGSRSGSCAGSPRCFGNVPGARVTRWCRCGSRAAGPARSRRARPSFCWRRCSGGAGDEGGRGPTAPGPTPTLTPTPTPTPAVRSGGRGAGVDTEPMGRWVRRRRGRRGVVGVGGGASGR
ncbi:hypothetical protein GCM10020295_52200 [Streptomyces cinereospinus]